MGDLVDVFMRHGGSDGALACGMEDLMGRLHSQVMDAEMHFAFLCSKC